MKPLVSVVCLCYNQRPYLREAIESVIKQTYDHLQVIAIDDASTDGSQAELEKIASEYPFIELILLPQNIGNCKAFNLALKKVKGEYVIDFAVDDVMKPPHIEKLVNKFQQLDQSYGVVFTDATYIDEQGRFLRTHFNYLLKKKLIRSIPQGDVFREVLTTYFIPGPTMLVRKKVMDDLGGYDESLAYEDFDFWLRSSRKYKYAFLDENEMLIRKSSRSLSSGWYESGDRQLHSTYLICCKMMKSYCQTGADFDSLKKRVLYEFRQSVFSNNKSEAKLFAGLLKEMNQRGWQYYFLSLLGRIPFSLRGIRKWYHRLRFA